MTQISLLRGIYSDATGEIRTAYPRNLVPVPTDSGISKGYLRPAEGVVQSGTGPGIGRGGINWNGSIYRVMGTKLVKIAADGTVTILGDVGGSAQVKLEYSFDRLAIASGGNLFYWDGSTLKQVTDPDLGVVVDVLYIAGYFMTTDGVNLIVTELTDPFSINPLKYGSSEADPDPVNGVGKLRNEAYAFNRYSIEVFQNVGGDLFPFAVIEGANVPRGVIGGAWCGYLNTFAFLGSGRDEAPAVWLLTPGDTQKLSTREVDQILLGYSEAQLATVVLESKVDKNHELLYIHLPDRCLAFDANATKAVGEPVWYGLDSGTATPSTYRARNLVWCYDRWNVEDPTSVAFGYLTDSTSSHYGATVNHYCAVPMIYNEGNGAIVHELELVALPGRGVALGADPVVWTSYSKDGETWSIERSCRAGKQGERLKRIAWRTQGTIENYRTQAFRWASDVHMSVIRLEVELEPLFTRPGVR